MRFAIEVKQLAQVPSLEQKMIRGADMLKVCEQTGATPSKDWEEKEYVSIMVPGMKDVETTIFKQSVDALDLGALVMLVNAPPTKE
ncbi:MAG: hypothetical protein ABIH03_06180 [Pseudomonadota bacterium]